MTQWLANLGDTGNQSVVLVLLILAVLRVFLEVIGYDFCALPLTKRIVDRRGEQEALKIHRTGFYLSVGYILLFAPQALFT